MDIFRYLFGCRHPRFSFPQTHRNKLGAKEPPHVCCLTCGARADYDWQNMKALWDQNEGESQRPEFDFRPADL